MMVVAIYYGALLKVRIVKKFPRSENLLSYDGDGVVMA
jgi:hypothetical protein